MSVVALVALVALVILYFIVYITLPCIRDEWCIDGGGGGGGVFVMYTIEIQNLHLRAGASQRRDSASERRDEIPPFTCIRNFIIPPTIPHRSSLENVPPFTCSSSWATSIG